jgi:DNA-binding transcriptional ArsR family regulator
MTATNTAHLDHRLVRALGHPLRQRILALLQRRVASPSEIAEELGEAIGNVSYHVKVLRENDAIELVETRPVRGAVEHFYRPLVRPLFDDEHWAQLPVASRRSLFANTVREIFEHVADAWSPGGFDDPRTHVSWTHLRLDEQAYGELTDRLAQLLDHALELEAQSLARRSGGQPLPERATELSMLHFHRDATGPAAPTPARPAQAERRGGGPAAGTPGPPAT